MAAERPRILFLTRNCPHGPSFGAQLRTLHTARHLQRCGDLSVALILLHEPDKASLSKTEAEFGLAANLRMCRSPIRGFSARLRHELDPWFLNTEGWELDPHDASRVSDLISRHDVVWIHNVAVANGARINSCPSSVLDVDDLQSRYSGSAFKSSSRLRERVLTLRRAWLWKRREGMLLRRFTVLTVCSEADRAYLGGGDRIHVIPNGFDLSEVPVRSLSNPPRIGFIGLLRYPPNDQGVRWFAAEIWPRIKQSFPAARLRLIGAGADPGLGGMGPDIDVLGWIDEPSSEMASWSLMITPIQMGGGTRIKIAEGFARKIPVVSTSLGAFGYGVTSGKELLLADRSEDFAQACLSILRNPELGARLAECGWEQYSKRWTWAAIGPGVHAAVERALQSQRPCRWNRTAMQMEAE